MGGMKKIDPDAHRLVAQNRKVRHEYLILQELEVGLVLLGSEVKSLRTGRCSLAEAHVRAKEGELFLVGAHIPEYVHAGKQNHEPTRTRKLLAHKREIMGLEKASREKGMTMVPLALYFVRQHLKLKIALVRGKKLHDKRATTRERDDKRELAREAKLHGRH